MKPLSSRIQNLCGRGYKKIVKKKDCKSHRWQMIPKKLYSRHSSSDSYMNSQRRWQHSEDLYNFQPNRFSELIKRSRNNIPLLTELLLVIYTYQEKEHQFSRRVLQGYINHIKEDQLDNTKQPQYFCALFCLNYFFLLIFSHFFQITHLF